MSSSLAGRSRAEGPAVGAGAIAKQIITVHADDRRELEIVRERAVLDDVGRGARRAETAAPDLRREGQRRRRARRERRVEPVDPIAELLVVRDQPRAGQLELRNSASRSPWRTCTSRIGALVLFTSHSGRWRGAVAPSGTAGRRAYAGDRRLRQLLVLQIFALIIGADISRLRPTSGSG